MKIDAQPFLLSRHGASAGWTPPRFALALALLLLAIFVLTTPRHIGDALEYASMTAALANHASPDIRLADIAAARAQMPPQYGPGFDALADGMRANAQVPLSGFYRGADGHVYAIHFFAYSALAAVPFTLLQAAGMPAFKCFQAVNLAFVFVLGMALLRLFGCAARAAVGVLAFLLCGGLLYLQWSSPECMSAAALLAGLVLYSTGAPLAGGLLGGIGALQNPPLVLFCAFAPLLRLCVCYRAQQSFGANLREALPARAVAGLVLAASLSALPVLFSLYQFDTPNLIVKFATEQRLITWKRLHSFFFDLNQGALLGVPAVAAALCVWPAAKGARWRTLALTVTAAAFTVALAVPSLATQNWNSGSAGIMRYAVWASMPLLFAFLWRLRLAPRWPLALLAAVVTVQTLAMASAHRYGELQFSPLATRVLQHAPGWYHPDPEIFWERAQGHESFPEPQKIFSWPADGPAVKTLYHQSNLAVDAQLCGPGRRLARENRVAEADYGWRYIDGIVRCEDAPH